MKSACADPESFVRGVQHWQRLFVVVVCFLLFFVDGIERGSKCH